MTAEKIKNFIKNTEIEFYPKQPNLCIPIIIRMYKKMKAGIKFPAIKVITEDNLISDGHHRYIASLLAQHTIERISYEKTSADIRLDWVSINFEIKEWESPEDIQTFNEKDALYNNITLAQILEILE